MKTNRYVNLNDIGKTILDFVHSDDYERVLHSMKYDTHEFEEGFMQGLVWSFIVINQDRPTFTGEERKHGKWIVKDKGIHVTDYVCSECGRTVRDDTGYDVTVDYPYCHCGAEMNEVEE